MRRVVILGCPGSGKTTLAQRLGERLDLPVVHLETLYWLPGWRAPDDEIYRERFAAAFAQEAWISEGNFVETFHLRLRRADLVIVIERSRWVCLWRVLRRAVLERGERPDLATGCREQLDWKLLRYVWRYETVSRPPLESARIAHGAAVPVIRLRSNREIEAFLARLPRSPP